MQPKKINCESTSSDIDNQKNEWFVTSAVSSLHFIKIEFCRAWKFWFWRNWAYDFGG